MLLGINIKRADSDDGGQIWSRFKAFIEKDSGLNEMISGVLLIQNKCTDCANKHNCDLQSVVLIITPNWDIHLQNQTTTSWCIKLFIKLWSTESFPPMLILPFRSSNTRSSEQVSAGTLPNTHPCVTPHSHAQIQCVHFKPNLLTQKMRNSHVAPTIMIK